MFMRGHPWGNMTCSTDATICSTLHSHGHMMKPVSKWSLEALLTRLYMSALPLLLVGMLATGPGSAGYGEGETKFGFIDRVVRTVVCPSTLYRELSTAPFLDFTLPGALARSSSRSIKVHQNGPASSNSPVCVGPCVNTWNGTLSVTENTRLEGTNLS